MQKIIIIGVGALGSHVVQFIRNLEAEIKIVDFDRVEQKNVLSQFHSKSGVGKNKVQALQQLMSFLYGQKLNVIPHKLVESNAAEILNGASLVIDCLDNGESRRLVQNFCRKNDLPCLHGALSADGSFGCSVWDHQFVVDDAQNVGAPTCENGENLPFIALVAGYIARSTQEFFKTNSKISYRVHPGGILKT